MLIMKEHSRYLLVRSKTGLNDTLSEIEKCLKYCEHYGRRLVIDTEQSGIFHALSRYLEPLEEGIADFEFTSSHSSLFSGLSVVPPGLTGRLSEYKTRWDPKVGNFVDENTGEKTTFDFGIDHSAELLVHEQVWTGRLQSLEFLKRCQFTEQVATEVKRRLKRLEGLAYCAVHVRNTDYTTDYPRLFEELRESVIGVPVLICSDDSRVFAYAQSALPGSEVFRLASQSDSDGSPIHGKRRENQYEVNMQMFTDLLALAQATNIFSANVDQIPRRSGFTLLAMGLHANKQIVRQLLRLQN